MSGKTKVILFYMNGCGPCKRFMNGTLKEFQAADDFKNYDFQMYEAYTPDHQTVIRDAGISMFPSMSIVAGNKSIKDGVVTEFSSITTLPELREFIKRAETQSGGARRRSRRQYGGTTDDADFATNVGIVAEKIARTIAKGTQTAASAVATGVSKAAANPSMVPDSDDDDDDDDDNDVVATDSEVVIDSDAVEYETELPTNVEHTEMVEGRVDTVTKPVVTTEIAKDKQAGGGDYRRKYLKYKLKYEQAMKRIF